MLSAASRDVPTYKPARPAQGDVLDRKYRIGAPIGAGAMGIVVAAHHLHLDERVAIKLLREDYAESAEFTARFLQEGRAMIKIRSEHVVRVLDVGAHEDGAAPYLVMEYLEGCDLDALLASRGPFPVAEAIDLILQGVEAIAEAHALGIVHRDLKPGNLFLTKRRDGSPCLKVLDFGISMFDRPSVEEARITQATAVMGSPAYMSPEQMRSTRNVDARTDIWALGVILYEMLTGTAPFAGRTGPEVCACVLEGWPRSMRALRPALDPALESAVHRCLEKDPARRFANVAELARALAPFGTAAAARSAETAANVLAIPQAAHSTPSLGPSTPSLGPSTPPSLGPSTPRLRTNTRGGAQVAQVAPHAAPSEKSSSRSSYPVISGWGRDKTLVSGRLEVPAPRRPRRVTLGAIIIGAAALAGAVMAPLGASRSEVRASAPGRTFVSFEVHRAPVANAAAAAAAAPIEEPAPPTIEWHGELDAPRVRAPRLQPASAAASIRAPAPKLVADSDPAAGLFDERK